MTVVSSIGLGQENTILVEFVGLPGSGKSTLADRLVAVLNKKDIGVHTPIKQISAEMTEPWERYFKKGTASVLLSFQSPRLYYHSCKSILRGSWDDKQRATSLILYFGYLYHAYRNNWSGRQTKVFDQGLFQFLWSIYFTNDSNEQYISVFDEIVDRVTVDSWVIVNVEAETDIIQDRLGERKASKSNLQPDTVNKGNYILKKVKQKQKHYQDFNENIDILEVKNSRQNDLEPNIEKIYAELEAHII